MSHLDTLPTARRRPILAYLGIAYLFTWACWIGAWLIARAEQFELRPGLTVFETIAMAGQAGFIAQGLFTLGVFGPLLGYVVLRRYRPFFGRMGGWPLALAVVIPLVCLVPAGILSAIFVPAATDLPGASALTAIGLFAVSNLLTSGTEEFGWRGYLYPALKERGHSFWSNAWRGGLLWAAWHLPLMVMLYAPLGAAMLPTLAGFVASIIAMNYITNALYEHSDSIFVVMLLHALNNTATFALMLIFPTTPFTIVVAVMAWMFVWFLERRLVLGSGEMTAERGS